MSATVRQTMLRNNITKIVTENIKYALRVAKLLAADRPPSERMDWLKLGAPLIFMQKLEADRDFSLSNSVS
jgi:hypothetical protein